MNSSSPSNLPYGGEPFSHIPAPVGPGPIVKQSRSPDYQSTFNTSSHTTAHTQSVAAADAIRDQDRLLPIANISRIMKRTLPSHAKMSREAKHAIQECVSEFIGFITCECSYRLQEEKRKTITGDDVLDAMKALGFDNYLPLLTVYLSKYRLAQNRMPTSKKAKKTTIATNTQITQQQDDIEEEEEEEEEPNEVPQSPNKKIKR